MVGKSRSRCFSLIPWGKKATTLGATGVEETSESGTVAQDACGKMSEGPTHVGSLVIPRVVEISYAAPINNAGIYGRLRDGKTVVIRGDTKACRVHPPPNKSDIGSFGVEGDDEHLFGGKEGRSGVRSPGFLTPAPMILESRAKEWARETGNWTQRMNRRFSSKRSLIRV